MKARGKIPLWIGLAGLAQGCAPMPPQVTPKALCEMPAPDTGSWQRLQIGSNFTVSAPPDLVPDTSVVAGLTFYHGGQQWLEQDLIVYWDLSNPATGGLLHDSLEARLARADEWNAPTECAPPTPPDWVVRSSISRQGRQYTTAVWMMREQGTRNDIYHLNLTAQTESAFVDAIWIVRSLRPVRDGGG